MINNMKRQREQKSEQIDSGSNKAAEFDIKKFFKAPDALTDEDFVSLIILNPLVGDHSKSISFQKLVEFYLGTSNR